MQCTACGAAVLPPADSCELCGSEDVAMVLPAQSVPPVPAIAPPPPPPPVLPPPPPPAFSLPTLSLTSPLAPPKPPAPPSFAELAYGEPVAAAIEPGHFEVPPAELDYAQPSAFAPPTEPSFAEPSLGEPSFAELAYDEPTAAPPMPPVPAPEPAVALPAPPAAAWAEPAPEPVLGFAGDAPAQVVADWDAPAPPIALVPLPGMDAPAPPGAQQAAAPAPAPAYSPPLLGARAQYVQPVEEGYQLPSPDDVAALMGDALRPDLLSHYSPAQRPAELGPEPTVEGEEPKKRRWRR